MITDNPIVNEVRRVREEMLDSYGGDLNAMIRDLMKKQFERGREVVRLAPRRPVLRETPERYTPGRESADDGNSGASQ